MTREDMARACEDVGVGAVVEDVNAHLFAAAAELRKMCATRRHAEPPVSSFDPHALAMALQLADLIERESLGIIWSGARMSEGDAMLMARWLRAKTQKELESQS